jgi:hypothetical protein
LIKSSLGSNETINETTNQTDYLINEDNCFDNLNEYSDKQKLYEVSFIPERDSICFIEITYLDIYETIISGNFIKIWPKFVDFSLIPYPLDPFPLNQPNSFERNY